MPENRNENQSRDDMNQQRDKKQDTGNTSGKNWQDKDKENQNTGNEGMNREKDTEQQQK